MRAITSSLKVFHGYLHKKWNGFSKDKKTVGLVSLVFTTSLLLYLRFYFSGTHSSALGVGGSGFKEPSLLGGDKLRVGGDKVGSSLMQEAVLDLSSSNSKGPQHSSQRPGWGGLLEKTLRRNNPCAYATSQSVSKVFSFFRMMLR